MNSQDLTAFEQVKEAVPWSSNDYYSKLAR